MKTQNTITGNVVSKKVATKRTENLIVSNVNLLKETKTPKVKVIKSKEEIKAKRLLNPQFSHVLSKQKKQNEKDFKGNAKAVFIATKNIVGTIQESSYNVFENANLIEKCKGFINFVTKTNKSGEIVNVYLYDTIINNVRTTKSGFYNEFYFAQLIQKVVKLSIDKGHDFTTSLNIVIETKKATKK